ncbi:unnamed protein product [Arabis nemorensis]|uniref:Uncharacterized protein n=1 Tax=Arabis nemorensis TaxID=586526 RepID=A0A565BIL9_9BRAS|nr:unnamed protein product [Arabis nemorensis]
MARTMLRKKRKHSEPEAAGTSNQNEPEAAGTSNQNEPEVPLEEKALEEEPEVGKEKDHTQPDQAPAKLVEEEHVVSDEQEGINDEAGANLGNENQSDQLNSDTTNGPMSVAI